MVLLIYQSKKTARKSSPKKQNLAVLYKLLIKDYLVHQRGSPTSPSPSNFTPGLKWKSPF